MRIASAWQLLLPAALCCCCCIGAAAGEGRRCRFPAVFIFGDSNSDTGGFWATFPAQPPPFGVTYFGRPAGRASDGRLVIDFIGHGAGAAVPAVRRLRVPARRQLRHARLHGAAAQHVALRHRHQPLLPRHPAPADEGAHQQSHRLRRHHWQKNNLLTKKSQLPPPDVFGDSLYTIDIGQNDFTSNLASQGIEGVKQTLPSVISQISWTMQDLYGIGARKFMVFNMAPIGCYPVFLVELPHSSDDLDEYGCMTSYNSAVVYYNELLNNSLAEVRKTLRGASIVLVDKYSAMLELFRHPEDHGLKYGTKACCGYGGGAYNFNPDLYCGTSKIVNGKIASATASETRRTM